MSEVVITAGGTREKIDDVRYIGNFSTGRLGHRIAEVYGKWTSDNITLIAPQATIDRFGLPENVRHEPFVTSQELREKLLGIVAADVVIHSAAVSDYIPDFTQGKIKSDEDELVVTMRRNPKILSDLRDHFGNETKLVGFKLLSGATEGELYEAGLRQIRENKLDYCVANDLQKITRQNREVHIIQKPDGPVRNDVQGSAYHRWHSYNGDTNMVGERIVRRLSHVVDAKIRSQPYEVEWGGRRFWIDPMND